MVVRRSRSEANAYISRLQSEGYAVIWRIDKKDNLTIEATKPHMRWKIEHTNNGWLKVNKYYNGIKLIEQNGSGLPEDKASTQG